MMSQPPVQIYILSRDRPDYLRQTLQSALQQPDAEVIVSDNSESDAVEKLLATEFPQVRLIRRWPTLPALLHFRTIIEESQAEFLVMFHDDDLLLPDYVPQMLAAMRQHPQVAAIGCNARLLQGETETSHRTMGRPDSPILITSPEKLAEYYLRYSRIRPAPFPGYMYRRNSIEGLFLDPAEGGEIC